MENNSPFIHLFKNYDKSYLYDVNSNTITKISDDVYNKLLKNDLNDFNIKKMKEIGLLSNNRLTEIIHPEDKLLEFHLADRVNMIILQITQNCNLRCNYCPYSGGYENREHSNKKMNFETAKKGIDFLLNHSTYLNRVSVGFYGGEPLLEYDLIKKCIEYAEQKGEGKIISFNITTNATLLTEEIVRYFSNHNVSLMISLDGPKHVQDKNRIQINNKGSFDTVIKNIKMIKEKFPNYAKKIKFNCVLDAENSFSCINDFFVNCEEIKDFSVSFNSINKEYLKTNKSDNSELYLQESKYEMFKLYLSTLGRVKTENVSKILYSSYNKLKERFHDQRYFETVCDKGHPSGPCIPGVQRLFVDVNENFFPCEKCSESSEVLNIGNLDDGFNIEKIKKLLNIGKLTEQECKNCWAFKFCTVCAVSADGLDELSKSKKLSHCNKVRNEAEGSLKDYCLLKELGNKFEKNIF